MTSPGLWYDEYHRYFYGTDGPLPSVTTVLKIVDKSGPLVGWAKRETAASAVRNLDMLASMVRSGGVGAAQSWLSRIPDYQRDTKANIGQRIHSLASAMTNGQQVNVANEEVPYLHAWFDFARTVQPQIVFSETSIANLTHRYGGTFDLGCLIDGHWTLLDIKTGKGVYPETALQLAGYAEAEFWATADDPTKRALPKWDRFGVLHLQPAVVDEPWRLVPFVVDDLTRAAFYEALRLWRWSKDYGPWSQGTPITAKVMKETANGTN